MTVPRPRIFCAVTETIAAMVRRRCAGRGVHILAYVDGFLIVGDSEEAARYGGAVFEAEEQQAPLFLVVAQEVRVVKQTN